MCDEEIEQMTPDDLFKALKAHDHTSYITTNTGSTEELQAKLKQLQKTAQWLASSPGRVEKRPGI